MVPPQTWPCHARAKAGWGLGGFFLLTLVKMPKPEDGFTECGDPQDSVASCTACVLTQSQYYQADQCSCSWASKHGVRMLGNGYEAPSHGITSLTPVTCRLSLGLHQNWIFKNFSGSIFKNLSTHPPSPLWQLQDRTRNLNQTPLPTSLRGHQDTLPRHARARLGQSHHTSPENAGMAQTNTALLEQSRPPTKLSGYFHRISVAPMTQSRPTFMLLHLINIALEYQQGKDRKHHLRASLFLH